MRRALELWVPVAFWMGLIFWLSSIPGLHVAKGMVDFVLRKMAHIFMFFVLTVLYFRSNQETFPSASEARVVAWSVAAAGLYAVSDEMHQLFVPHRGPSLHDVLIDGVGIALAALLWWFRPALLRLKNSNL